MLYVTFFLCKVQKMSLYKNQLCSEPRQLNITIHIILSLYKLTTNPLQCYYELDFLCFDSL